MNHFKIFDIPPNQNAGVVITNMWEDLGSWIETSRSNDPTFEVVGHCHSVTSDGGLTGAVLSVLYKGIEQDDD